MPCDEQRTVSLDFRNADETLLQESLDELGIAGRYDKPRGLLSTNASEESQSALRRLYTKKLVFKAAKEKKWKVEEKAGKLILTR